MKRFLILLVCSLCTSCAALAQNDISFVRKSGGDAVILFVHGILGEGETTWIHDRSGTSWPHLLLDDDAFNGTDVATYQYPTSVFESNYSIDEVADHFHNRIKNKGIDQNYENVVIVAHSMGGLVTRNLLLKYRDLISPKLLYFAGTPTNGSDLANFAAIFSKNSQLAGLRTLEKNQVLQITSSQWLASDLKAIPTYCAYEKRKTKGLLVVPRSSATALCNQRLDPIPENHFRMVKPASRSADSYVAFKVAYGEIFSRQKLISKAGNLTINADSPEQNITITANKLTVVGDVVLTEGTLIVANDIDLSDGRILSDDLVIVTTNLIGGVIDARPISGTDGGRIVVGAARISGTQFLANGLQGEDGADGKDGSRGPAGKNGRAGRCDGFGRWRAAIAGTNGRPGTNGHDGKDGKSGGDGGTILLVSLGGLAGIQAQADGGIAGRGGQGGSGGQGGAPGGGGRGCTGLGGMQTNAASGTRGRNGNDGRNGQDGRPGEPGKVDRINIGDFSKIVEFIPNDDEIPEYRSDIIAGVERVALQ